MQNGIDYQALMQGAMRRLVAEVLGQVAETGLPGEHHFFITFDTTHPDVAMADWLHDRYPREMTVVLQHWFDNLTVDDKAFTVTLNFGNQPEPLSIPLDAILTFVDPLAEFGLRFDGADEDEDDDEEAPLAEVAGTADEAPRQDADVVRLDQFRK